MIVEYFVANENALVHSTNVEGLYGVLAGDALSGGPDPFNGPICVTDDLLRPANDKDFAQFRVHSKFYFRGRKPT